MSWLDELDKEGKKYRDVSLRGRKDIEKDLHISTDNTVARIARDEVKKIAMRKKGVNQIVPR